MNNDTTKKLPSAYSYLQGMDAAEHAISKNPYLNTDLNEAQGWLKGFLEYKKQQENKNE